jgi:hypothetical protein
VLPIVNRSGGFASRRSGIFVIINRGCAVVTTEKESKLYVNGEHKKLDAATEGDATKEGYRYDSGTTESFAG